MRRSKGSELAPTPPDTAQERGTPLVTLLMFAPVKLAARRIAPRVSARLFARLWEAVDGSQPPPRPEQRQQSVPRLAVALALEGACTAVVGGLLDQVSRRQFARLTGRWPSRRKKSQPAPE